MFMPNMTWTLFIFRNILCSYFLSTNYSHHLINKKVIFKLASSRSLGHTWDFL